MFSNDTDIIDLFVVIVSAWGFCMAVLCVASLSLDDLLPEGVIKETLSRFFAAVRTERAMLAHSYTERPRVLLAISVIRGFKRTFSRQNPEHP